MDGRHRLAAAALVLAALTACAPADGPSASRSPAPASRSPGSPATSPSPSPSPVSYPPYFIESLRNTPHPGGLLQVGAQMARGTGYTKYHMTWPSQGQTMTGTISIPDGTGPFPVVVVNHGYIPASRYWIGQDSGIFGDPMAAHGIISVAPNYPGYAGSGTLDPALPALVAEAVADLDLISSLTTLPRADARRVAVAGHSNGGGVSLLLAVIDPRIRVMALFAPVSSDMADNARKWWGRDGSRGAMPAPDQAPDQYAHISPRNYFTATTPPAIFLQGTADQDIPADWTNATLQALTDRGVATAVNWYPGAQHDMVGANLADAVARAEAFIRAHV